MKILYLMHIDWNWIKQRPHFIAEKLVAAGIKVDVYYNKIYNKKVLAKLTKNKKEFSTIYCIPRIPISRFVYIKKLNEYIYKVFLKIIIRLKKYDYVYLTHPSFYSCKVSIPVIYDCMDDILGFSSDETNNKILFKLEQSLVTNAKFVFFTSEYLKDTVLKRYGVEFNNKKFLINNNAIELPQDINFTDLTLSESSKIKMVYIGTIASWFDFDILKKINPNKYEFHLFGPKDTEENDFPENFIFHNSVPREQIFSIMKASDILIMPFIVTDLIKSVNPVKLYEYIFSCKPVISVRYGETEKFSDYVYLYENNDLESFMLCVKLIEENQMQGKNTEENCRIYVESNTWKNRIDSILNHIAQ